jgi:hypothetical protein
MPGRGHKIASRQAQLGQRRRKHARQGAAVATHPHPVAPSVEEAEGVSTQPATLATSVPATNPGRPTPRAQAQYHPVVVDHVGGELRRIGIMGITALAVLIALSIVVL